MSLAFSLSARLPFSSCIVHTHTDPISCYVGLEFLPYISMTYKIFSFWQSRPSFTIHPRCSPQHGGSLSFDKWSHLGTGGMPGHGDTFYLAIDQLVSCVLLRCSTNEGSCVNVYFGRQTGAQRVLHNQWVDTGGGGERKKFPTEMTCSTGPFFILRATCGNPAKHDRNPIFYWVEIGYKFEF